MFSMATLNNCGPLSSMANWVREFVAPVLANLSPRALFHAPFRFEIKQKLKTEKKKVKEEKKKKKQEEEQEKKKQSQVTDTQVVSGSVSPGGSRTRSAFFWKERKCQDVQRWDGVTALPVCRSAYR